MVIINTSAMEVSIQAVSPEFGEQLICILASHAGTGGSGSACWVAGAGVGACAYEWLKVDMLRKMPSSSASTSAVSPAPENFLNVMVSTPVRNDEGRC